MTKQRVILSEEILSQIKPLKSGGVDFNTMRFEDWRFSAEKRRMSVSDKK